MAGSGKETSMGVSGFMDGMVYGNPMDTAKGDFGIGGINGMHHDDFGWDNTTVGMASSVFDNLLSQNGVRSNDPNYIGALEPIRAGRFIVKWLKVPSFFNKTAVKYLKFFLENAVKSVSGLTDNTIAAAGDITFGANGQNMSFPGSLKENNQTVSLSTVTCTGDGLGKLMRYWMYGITDPVTGIHHMYGKDLRFIRPNYSGTLMYIFMGPTCRPGDIEYACIWHEVWPTSGNGTGQWESQEIGSDSAISEKQIDFTGIFQDGPEVNILAKYIVAGTGLAGQSYFDQMLPAYMYDQFMSKLSAKDNSNGLMDSMNLTAEGKLNAAATSGVGVYGDENNGAIATRNGVLEKYGINSSKLPPAQLSNEEPIVNHLIEKEVDAFSMTNIKDPINQAENVFSSAAGGAS